MKLQGEAAPDKKESPSSRAKMIFRKREPYPFLISNMREKDLIRKLSGWATLKVWGGPAVTIGSVAYLFTLMRSPFE
ncbi:MAG: hypothetical protein GWM98_26830 [Nitrospinaceae bacterium]|nr:hypothetical protein [Nitrospinaceae bacterium]NIR57417.1 hypothetical protein [Nitrospinaceae bacterium]NIS87875.1 hypothetical protein [Nitrospinaceae bacterium]NIT84742.1 hypothetical protein [Nitrospinaceae bacterium]NIU46920.1 hypothetical protein [Nitrospinaceae bacterium]